MDLDQTAAVGYMVFWFFKESLVLQEAVVWDSLFLTSIKFPDRSSTTTDASKWPSRNQSPNDTIENFGE